MMITLAAVVFSCGGWCIPQEGENPEWAAWKDQKIGTWVKYASDASINKSPMAVQERTITLMEVSSGSVVIDTKMIQGAPESRTTIRAKKESDDSGDRELGRGKETIEAAGRKFDCDWVERGKIQPRFKAVTRTWYSKDVPGAVVKMVYTLEDPGASRVFVDIVKSWSTQEKPASPKSPGGSGPQSSEPPRSDAETETLFIKARLQIAESHLSEGRKEKAAEILEDVLKSYPQHSLAAEARRMLEQARRN